MQTLTPLGIFVLVAGLSATIYASEQVRSNGSFKEHLAKAARQAEAHDSVRYVLQSHDQDLIVHEWESQLLPGRICTALITEAGEQVSLTCGYGGSVTPTVNASAAALVN